jgi:glycopeptide antibiotics resistance protein
VFLVAGVAIVLVATLYPFRFEPPYRLLEMGRYFEGLNFGGYSRCCTHLAILEPAANLMLFIPLGFGLSRTLQRIFPFGGVVWFSAMVFCVTMSLSIEILQVLQPERSPSLSDVLMNSFGGSVGIWAGRMVNRWLERRRVGSASLG